MINKCHYWQLTMNYYYDICVLCWRWLGLLFSVLNVFGLPLCARRQTLQQGTGCTVRDLWPCPLPRRGWSLSVSCGSFDSSPCSEHSALRLAISLSRCFSANQWHQVLNWNFFGPWDGGREPDISTDLHGQSGLQGAAAVPSQLVCTILYSPSPCVSPPLFLYSNGETLLVYVFDICTNAPLWKRKWNLDISGINGHLVSLFEYQHYQTLHLKPYLS